MERDHAQERERLDGLARSLAAELPAPMGAFGRLRGAATADGALSAKVKELMALAIGVHAGCEGCVSYHVQDALRAGATREELLETIGVAVFMGGGPAVICGCEAFDAVDQLAPAGADG